MKLKGEFDGVTIIDDYGHHPNEIKATLEAATSLVHELLLFSNRTDIQEQCSFRRIRTLFENCDKLFITDIYAASEKPIPE